MFFADFVFPSRRFSSSAYYHSEYVTRFKASLAPQLTLFCVLAYDLRIKDLLCVLWLSRETCYGAGTASAEDGGGAGS